MNASARHPGHEEWMAWIRRELDKGAVDAMTAHLEGCVRCRDEVSVLQLLADVAVEAWVDPPEDIYEAALEMPATTEVPPRTEDPEVLEVTPADVRGGETAAVDGAMLLSPSSKNARMSLMVRPPDGGGRWLISGRLWLKGRRGGSIVAVLVENEHVLHTIEFEDGASFRIEEVAGPGWELEFHLPSASCFIVGNPFA